jgi:hypothetical protein
MTKKYLESKLRLAIAVTAVALLSAGCQELQELMDGYSEPEWTSVVNHRDGRRFVTDGKIAIDVKFAEPKKLPTTTSASWFDSALYHHSIAEKQELFANVDIRADPEDATVLTAPGGLVFDKAQIDYVRGKFHGRLSFWQFQRMEPVVIMVDKQAIGVLRVLSQP